MALFFGDQLGSEDDRTIFHYTDAVGLEGIVRTKSLWASSIIYLNDSQEIYHAYKRIRSYVNAHQYSDTDRLLIDLAIYRASGTQSHVGGDFEHFGVFVVSFSSVPDDLSQWRAYASNHGYCIGFAPSQLKLFAEPQEFSLERVRYDLEEQNALIQPIIDSYLSASRELNVRSEELESLKGRWPWPNNKKLMELADIFRASSHRIAPLLKNHSFRKEEEWRLVSNRGIKRDIHFRINENGIMPYTKIDLSGNGDDIGVRVVVAGPSPRMNLDYLSSALIFSVNKVKCGGFTTTRTPYRNW